MYNALMENKKVSENKIDDEHKTDSKLEYYTKSTIFHTIKAVSNKKSRYAITALATIAPIYMANVNIIPPSDADTQGTEQNETVLDIVSDKQTKILQKISNYHDLQKTASTYTDDANFDLASSLLSSERQINNLAKEFMISALASGSQEEGIAISEVEFRQMANDILNSDFTFDKNIQEAMEFAVKSAEHLDEARAISIIPENISSTNEVFNLVAANISKRAHALDNYENDLTLIAPFGGVLSFMLVGLGLTFFKDQFKYIKKPQKPDFMKKH